MNNRRKQHLKLGLLVTAGLAFFIISIYLLGKKQYMFHSVITVQSTFNDVKGLKQGNNVRFSGINIGTVSDIEIENDSTVIVEMSIKKNVRQFIRKDSGVEIENEGLMGNKIITIYPGSSHTALVEKGDFLQSTNSLATEDLLDQAKDIIVDGKEISGNLAHISQKLNNGSGDFAVLLNDNSISKQINNASKELLDITILLKDIVYKINSGDGDLAKLINNQTITTQMNQVIQKLDSTSATTHEISKNLLHTTEQINHGNGIVNRLIYDSVLANDLEVTFEKVNAGLDEAKKAAETIEKSWILNVFDKEKEDKSENKKKKKKDLFPDEYGTFPQ